MICSGHFADGAEKFIPETLEGETKPQWYPRQMLGSGNFRSGPRMAFMRGNLCYQIELHLMSVHVSHSCRKFRSPRNTLSAARQQRRGTPFREFADSQRASLPPGHRTLDAQPTPAAVGGIRAERSLDPKTKIT